MPCDECLAPSGHVDGCPHKEDETMMECMTCNIEIYPDERVTCDCGRDACLVCVDVDWDDKSTCLECKKESGNGGSNGKNS